MLGSMTGEKGVAKNGNAGKAVAEKGLPVTGCRVWIGLGVVGRLIKMRKSLN